jgi:hypothetical protein
VKGPGIGHARRATKLHAGVRAVLAATVEMLLAFGNDAQRIGLDGKSPGGCFALRPDDEVSRLAQGDTARVLVAIDAAVGAIREYRSPSPLLAEPFFLGLLAIRGAAEALSVYLYLRGSVLLVWWWEFLLESRHLLS